MMNIPELAHLYFQARLKFIQPSACIDWAIRCLQSNDEGDDIDIVYLAGASTNEDIGPLVERILLKYTGDPDIVSEKSAGKMIVVLARQYNEDKVSIDELDCIISRLYVFFDYPNWLTMLSRNCEYATDMQAFKKPFELELNYIALLWERSSNLTEFLGLYDREVSNSHDYDC
jgi:hypothetical protein